MSFVTSILILLAIILTLSVILYYQVKDKKEIKKELEKVQALYDSAKKNIEQLGMYIQKWQKIKEDEEKTGEKIDGAKTDEELYNIISDIIRNNNKLSK